ncbi:hypothetical protein [Burkholderia cenocepacia]|uniref:hypothetical protein n=1 Tax=Burkholderia cenocepacia TaxID=95486 RepID=UPI002B24A5CC|nr:hypothetical protein [Burkholderia cenocepacia]MEB2558817.1 hypothetical protein [Burkholderia cenocepacia]
MIDLIEVEDRSLHQLPINHRNQGIRKRAAGVVMLANRLKVSVSAQRLGVSGRRSPNGCMCDATEAWPVCGADDRGPWTMDIRRRSPYRIDRTNDA